jgi:hypothetical protein
MKQVERSNIIAQVHAISYMAIAILKKTTIIWDKDMMVVFSMLDDQ